jgi:hypothetical protein
LRREITDGRAGEINDVSTRRPARRRQFERLHEIRHDRQHFHGREVPGQRGCGGGEMLARNVYRHVGGNLIEMLQQNAGFQARAAAELYDAGGGPDALGDGIDVFPHDLQFGSGQVVLGQVADGLEQRRTPFVVEEFWRETLRRSVQPRHDLGEFVAQILVLLGQPDRSW